MSDIPPPPWQPPSGYSNYPREHQSTDPYRRPPGVYFDSIGQAWSLVQANLGTWVLEGLIFGAIYYAAVFGLEFLMIFSATSRSGIPATSTLILGIPLGIAVGCLMQILMAGQMVMGLKQARNEKIAVGDLFCAFQRGGWVILGMILTSICVFIGMCLCIVPGFFVAGLLMFVPLLIMDRNMTPIEAITTSYETLKPYAWAIFALSFVASLVASLGFCLCGIGGLFTFPIYYVTLGLTYNNFFPREAPTVFNQFHIGIEPPR